MCLLQENVEKNNFEVDNSVVKELLNLNVGSDIKMTVHGTTNMFHFGSNPSEDDFELYTNDSKIAYGLSCNSILEVIGVLIQDYANGIITDLKVL